MADQDIAVVGGTDIPLVRLNKLFNLNPNSGAVVEGKIIKEKAPLSNLTTIVLVKRGNDIAGIVVNKLVSQQEIIVKPLPHVMKDVKGFSGSTILGDGKTILILDAGGLLENTKRLVRTTYNP